MKYFLENYFEIALFRIISAVLSISNRKNTKIVLPLLITLSKNGLFDKISASGKKSGRIFNLA